MGSVVHLYPITSTEIGVSTAADPGNHCYTNSRKVDIRRVHYRDPTCNRTYIPAPYHNLLCTYPPSHIRSLLLPLARPSACQNPVRYKHTTHPIPLSYTSTCP